MESLSSLIPTDNLYRFLSITGILIFGFCFFYPDYRIYQIEQRQISLLGEGDILDIRIKRYEEEVENDAEEIKKIEDRDSVDLRIIQRIYKIDFRKLSIKENTRQINILSKSQNRLIKSLAKVKQIEKSMKVRSTIPDSLRITNVRLKTVNNLIKSDFDRVKQLGRIAIIGQIAGAAMILIGFLCWFFLIQSPQDKALRHQINELKNKQSIN